MKNWKHLWTFGYEMPVYGKVVNGVVTDDRRVIDSKTGRIVTEYTTKGK